ncbi:uncharacterized protein TNCV_916421 [Trichonephila clavipes]|nr:uncharacterized protein TNCV_916421 [Trichonephila clavipes]
MLWRRERALLKLLLCEEDLLNSILAGKEHFIIPLRKQYNLITSAEMDILFINIEEVGCVHEKHVQHLRQLTQGTEDNVGRLYQKQKMNRATHETLMSRQPCRIFSYRYDSFKADRVQTHSYGTKGVLELLTTGMRTSPRVSLVYLLVGLSDVFHRATATHCRLRLTWSREHALWTPPQWSCVMFFDESRFSFAV